MKKNYNNIAQKVIDLQINALKKVKNSLGKSFNNAVDLLSKCQSKVILCGVGKSGLIASKISATLSSVGTPSFTLSASDCSHGDLGSISKKDILILLSYSGNTNELMNLIQYVNRNRIKLIGIMSKKNSILYKNSNIKLLLPEVSESGHGIVPTSSTTAQLALGDALAISLMVKKKFGKLDFKKYHPSGSLGTKLRTVGDIMLTGNKIPFVKHNITMKNALNIISKKGLGVLFVRKNKFTTGILTDGDIKRISQKNFDFQKVKISTVMKKNPISIEKDTLAAKALEIMNTNRITSLCVHNGKRKNITVGILHIHNILNANIS